jgi:hypothetical protein
MEQPGTETSQNNTKKIMTYLKRMLRSNTETQELTKRNKSKIQDTDIKLFRGKNQEG